MKKIPLLLLCLFILACNNDPKVIKRDGEPDISQVDGDDKKMNKAIDEARKTLSQFDEALNSKDSLIESLAIKARFDTPDGGGEHIWLTDIVKKDGHYSGMIGNLPSSTTVVKLGETVAIPDDRISDWMYVQDGKLKGGYTIRVLRDQMSDAEKKVFDEENGLIIED